MTLERKETLFLVVMIIDIENFGVIELARHGMTLSDDSCCCCGVDVVSIRRRHACMDGWMDCHPHGWVHGMVH